MHFGCTDNKQYQASSGKKVIIFTEDSSEKGGYGYIKYLIQKLYQDCCIDLVQYKGADNIQIIPDYLESKGIRYQLIVVMYDRGRALSKRWDAMLKDIRHKRLQIIQQYGDRIVFFTPICFEEIVQQTYTLKEMQHNEADGPLIQQYMQLIDGKISQIDYKSLGRQAYEQLEKFVEREIEAETCKSKYTVRHKGGLQKCWSTECNTCKIQVRCQYTYEKCKYIDQINKQFMYYLFMELQMIYNRKYVSDTQLIFLMNNRNKTITNSIMEVVK